MRIQSWCVVVQVLCIGLALASASCVRRTHDDSTGPKPANVNPKGETIPLITHKSYQRSIEARRNAKSATNNTRALSSNRSEQPNH